MANSEIVKVKFLERIPRTQTVESFRFAPEKRIPFLPGQFMQVLFDECNQGNKDLNKYLSLSCSPQREYIEVTKRLSESAFSAKLRALKPGDVIAVKAPMGSVVFKDEYKKIAFLIGGIGVTPAISMIEYIMEKKLETDVVIFYSNRNEQEIAFRKELDAWAAANPRIKLVYTITECEPKDKVCFYGVINQALINEHMKDVNERILFSFGPPKMAEAMKNLCVGMGCLPEKVKTESFLGY